MENYNTGTTFVLKRVQRENPLLLVILRNNHFSVHSAMLKKSGRKARTLAKTRVDKPPSVKRSKEIGVFSLGRNGGRFVRVACPTGSPGEMNTEMAVMHHIPTVAFHPTKSRLWTGERKRSERRTPVCPIRLLVTCSLVRQSCGTVSSLYGNTHWRLT